jgi:hypothetical protein
MKTSDGKESTSTWDSDVLHMKVAWRLAFMVYSFDIISKKSSLNIDFLGSIKLAKNTSSFVSVQPPTRAT